MSSLEAVIFDFDGVLLDSYNPDRLPVTFFDRFIKGAAVPLVTGMDKVIHKLAADYYLAIVSSSSTGTITAFLEQHGLASYFKEIFSYDLLAGKADNLKQIIHEHGFTPGSCLFITDTTRDITEARLAGVPVVAVTWGFDQVSALHQAQPDGLVSKPDEILTWIEHFQGQK